MSPGSSRERRTWQESHTGRTRSWLSHLFDGDEPPHRLAHGLAGLSEPAGVCQVAAMNVSAAAGTIGADDN